MKKIQEVVQQKEWVLQCFSERYGRGVWAILVPHINVAYRLYELLDGCDNESFITCEYLLDKGAWLPTALDRDMLSALSILEEKVGYFEADTNWLDDVNTACQAILDSSFIKDCENPDKTLIRTGIIQPENGIYMLKKHSEGLKRITIDKRTLQVTNEEEFLNAPIGWTKKDVSQLLDEGRRFFGE